METLPCINKDDPRLRLKVENRMKNIFVTQFEETREEYENVNHIPVITETASRVLETGVNTLQRTLVLKKQVEVDETKDRAKKFEKFVEDNEVKRRRALKKYQVARTQNDLKQNEKEELTEQLEKLQARQQYLKDRVTMYKMYEDYMMKMLDFLPENYLEYGADSLVMPIIRRHETLSLTHQDLVERLGQLVEELEQGQPKEKNNQTEMKLMMHQGQSRDQVEEVGSLLIAVKNLAEQCYLHHYGPLEEIDMLTMMDMEYILERADIVMRATRLIDSGSALTSATEHRGSLKNINSKTQLKSTSKTSGRSGLSS
ncbi:unnamed protein product [Coregonus sp. 'balchen']|nr:unnamed protein product [Coregonus sp. 'balchen']